MRKIWPRGQSKNYTLPLNNDHSARFLIVLITLMSLLMVLACSGSFALNEMTSRWSSGLENKITIEIPPEMDSGAFLSKKIITKEAQKIADALENFFAVEHINIMSDDDIAKLISPWIGDDIMIAEIPMPGLIAITLSETNDTILRTLEKKITAASPYAHIETHHDWLSDLISFANSLKFMALLIIILIATITVTAITIAMQTRMRIYHKDIALLHHMGATDHYIARQFQHHAMTLSAYGSGLGTFIGLMITGILIWSSGQAETKLIPSLSLSINAFLILCLVPICLTLISMIASRVTVLRTLSKMP